MIKCKIFIFLIVFIIFSSFGLALSNESFLANESLVNAKLDITLMQEKNISLNRVNELYNDAYQLFEAQNALEEKGKIGNYDLVLSYCKEISNIKENALRANDELEVFINEYDEVSREYNLSSMQTEYDSLLNSFYEERFEDTLQLIPQGYDKISEIQSSQTNLRLFYDTTSRSLKKWFSENWKILSISFFILIVIYLISYKSIKKIMIKKEMNNLLIKKSALNSLIKRLQSQYFKENKISETEFKVKIERFKEMIRDVDRQIPLLNEKLAKLDYKNKSRNNVLSLSNGDKINIKRKKSK